MFINVLSAHIAVFQGGNFALTRYSGEEKPCLAAIVLRDDNVLRE